MPGWQPINTAPHDKQTAVDLWVIEWTPQTGLFYGRRIINQRRQDSTETRSWFDARSWTGVDEKYRVTHWRPIEIPEDRSEEQKTPFPPAVGG